MTTVEGLSVEEKAALTSGSDFWHTTAATGVPQIMMTDGPHGVRKQSGEPGAGMLVGEPATCFPPAVAMGSTWDPELVRRVGAALGEQARAMGVSVRWARQAQERSLRAAARWPAWRPTQRSSSSSAACRWAGWPPSRAARSRPKRSRR